MANISSSNNTSYHLADHTGTPIISSPSSSTPISIPQSQAQALSSLTTTALTAHDTASRLGLGLAQRILIETTPPGPLILHSFLNQASPPVAPGTPPPINGHGIVEQAREDLWLLSRAGEESSSGGASDAAGGEGRDGGLLVNGVGYGKEVASAAGSGEAEAGEEEGNARVVPPMLIGTVVAATSADAGEARRVAARLERIGRAFQREWVREQEVRREPAAAASGEEG